MRISDWSSDVCSSDLKVDEARVDEQDAVPGLVRDPGQLVAREARIERVRDRAHSGDGVPEREMMIAIARERRHAVARADALRGECARQESRIFGERGIAGTEDRKSTRMTSRP